ncbi:MAG TPA: Spy/CpxP family protein refolding chaperone [Gemmatimonadaceae bacterium]|nr:Spy/CpxP family protein refolding chaperone [Gemmatimonadaceae bacterium]
MGPGMMGPGMGMMGDDWGSMGPGMMGPGMMWFGPAYALDLTDKQRARLSEIQGDLIKPMWDLARKVDEQRAKLYEAYAAEPVDPKRVREIAGNIGQLQQQIAELRAKAHNEMMKVLTKDQREQLSNMRRGMWGQGMDGPGMMNRRRSTR